jgi:YegS/Rv2252/BmrU family lipid kinase
LFFQADGIRARREALRLKARFIVNPAAGGVDRLCSISDAVRSVLGDVEGIFEIRAARSKGSATALASDAARRGYDAAVACGGDGTVNEVASGLVNTSTALGVVPTGSGNVFAAALSIPMGVDAAMGVFKRPRKRRLDVGLICGRYFFSAAGCGFGARSSVAGGNGAPGGGLRRRIPYLLRAPFDYLFSRPESALINADGYSERLTPLMLSIANASVYGPGLAVAGGPGPEGGLLDLRIVPRAGLMRSLLMASGLLKGDVDAPGEVKSIRASRLEVIRRGRSFVHVDGEQFEWGGAITAEVLERRLDVLVP